MAEKTTMTGAPGSEGRWKFMSGYDVGKDNDPYLDRLRIIQTPLFGVYLHHIHREDRDRDPHDHPWWFASLILEGAYTERVFPDKGSTVCYTVHRHRFSWHRMGRGSAHMIMKLNAPLWTLVITGPRRGNWGFYPGGRFVPWREYIIREEK